jgi:serine/threonine protein kinase
MGAAIASEETVTHVPRPRPSVPAPVLTLNFDEYRQVVRELGLVDADDMDRFAAGAGGEVERLTQILVRSGRLTAYQAAAVSQGKAKGLLIGPYLVLDKIGAGGMGVVFKARHRPSGRVVAMKILPPSFAREREAVSRFRREFEVASRLSHPNLVAAIEASEDRGVHFLTMDYIDGTNLDRIVRDGGPLPLKLALHAVIQVARGLEAAHAQGVIHRDIKPGNVMIDGAGLVRVLDLGLARVIETGITMGPFADGSLTRTGSFMGTVDFLAPEQANDAKKADHRADLYSLGCTLYYLLAGRPPFPGETVLKRLMAHQDRPAPSLRAARPEVPESLEIVYQRLMAKQPGDRPRTAAETILALEACRATAREAGDASADFKTFAHSARRMAVSRGPERSANASIPAPLNPFAGAQFGPDPRFQDLVVDIRDEAQTDPSPGDMPPPRPIPATTTRRRRHAGFGIGTLVVVSSLVAAGVWWAARPRPHVVESIAATSTIGPSIDIVEPVETLTFPEREEMDDGPLSLVDPVDPGPASTPELPPAPAAPSTPAPSPAPPSAPAPATTPLPAPGPAPTGPEKGRVIVSDDHSDPKSGWPRRNAPIVNGARPLRSDYENGVYFIEVPETWSGAEAWDISGPLEQEYQVEVVGKVKGVGNSPGAWGVIITGEKGRGFQVGIDRLARVAIHPAFWGVEAFPNDPVYLVSRAHRAIKPGNEWNTMTLRVRRREMEVLVNGVKVCATIKVPWNILPARPEIAIFKPDLNTRIRADYDRVEVRELPPEG